MKAADYVADFQALAANGPPPVRVSAIRALASANPPDLATWAQKIVLSDAPNEARAEALRAMSRSVAGLNAILDLAEKNQLPAEMKSLATNLTNNAAPPRPVAGADGAAGRCHR